MADGELGNLRRAPRLIEHKITKQSRYRTEGMAGGQFDAVIPVDLVDDMTNLGYDGTGEDAASPNWISESFSLTSGAASTLSLTYVPADQSEILRLNGITLVETVDYTILENVVTWTSAADLVLGIGSDTWTVAATYAYYDQAITTDLTPIDQWQLNGTAVALGSNDVQLVNLGGSDSGSAISELVASWSVLTATFDVYTASSQAQGFFFALLDSTTHSRTFLTSSGIYPPGNGHTMFYPNPPSAATSRDIWQALSADGTSYNQFYSGTAGGGASLESPANAWQTFTIDIVKDSGAPTASCTITRASDGKQIIASPDMWIPASFYVAIGGYNGLFAGPLEIRNVSASYSP